MNSDLEIRPCHDVDPDALGAFYEAVYGPRAAYLRAHWRWHYRSASVEHRVPLAAVRDGVVVGHAGGVPFTAETPLGPKSALWFIDFAIRPEHQRTGIGQALSRAWMEVADLCVTFCNEKSIGVFKKLGWTESFDTSLTTLSLRRLRRVAVFDHLPGWALAAIGRCAFPYDKFARTVDVDALRTVTADELHRFERPTSANPETTPVRTLRDAATLTWRFLESPDRGRYRVVSAAGHAVIIKLGPDRSIDVLLHAGDGTPEDLRQLLAGLALFGIRRGDHKLRIYTGDRSVAAGALEGLAGVIARPRFAYFTRDEELQSAAERSGWSWSLADSDFETIGLAPTIE